MLPYLHVAQDAPPEGGSGIFQPLTQAFGFIKNFRENISFKFRDRSKEPIDYDLYWKQVFDSVTYIEIEELDDIRRAVDDEIDPDGSPSQFNKE